MEDPNFISNHTYEYANSKWNFMGTGRSDQQIFNDRAVTDAHGEGKDTFINSNGLEQTVSSYSRNIAPPRANSFLANMNKPLTVPGVAGAGLGGLTSGLISGPLGWITGQIVNAGVNSMFNTPEDVPTGKNSNYTPSAVTSSPLGPPGIDGDDGLWYDEGNNAQAEYEAAANAMEFPGNAPFSTPNYAPDAVTSSSPINANYAPDAVSAISTLAGIGSGLLGSLGETQGPSNEDYAYAMETPGLLGNVVSVPTTVASVGEVGDPAAVSGGFPGATPGFSSLSQHNMSARDFMAMVNMSDANSMAAQTGNAYNTFAANFAKNNPNSGYNGLQNAWEASRTAAEAQASAAAQAAANTAMNNEMDNVFGAGYSGNDSSDAYGGWGAYDSGESYDTSGMGM